MAKVNNELGWQVHKHLVEKGVETPAFFDFNHAAITNPDNIDSTQSHVAGMMNNLGLDLTDDSLAETPHRIAKMWHQEIAKGLDYNEFPNCMEVENKFGYDELICVKDIEIKSLCEHHWQPIAGYANIAYLPSNKVIGLSKLARVADFFSRRPQVQERLTLQIAYALQYVLDTPTVAVYIDAEHFCMKMRGVEEPCSTTATSYMGGEFRSNPSLKQEFFNTVK